MSKISIESTSDIGQYLGELRKLPAISKEEELEFFLKYREENCINSMHRIITANLRYVVYIAKFYKNSYVQFQDLIQEGNVGLMVAAKKFDPIAYPDTRFISYAAPYIKSNISECIHKFEKTIKFATTKQKRKLIQNLPKIDYQNQTNANIIHIAETFNVSEKVVSQFLQWKTGDIHLDNIITADSIQNELVANSNITSDIYKEQINSKLNNAIEKLNPREQNIIKCRFLSDNPKTYQELGKEQGCSLQRIQQVETRAIKKIREHISKEGIYSIYA